MADPIVQKIVDKHYGTSSPDLTPEMIALAGKLAAEAFRKTRDAEEWVHEFATGDEATDRPLFREFRRTVLHTLVDLAQDELRK